MSNPYEVIRFESPIVLTKRSLSEVNTRYQYISEVNKISRYESQLKKIVRLNSDINSI